MRIAIVEDDVKFAADVEAQIRGFFQEKQEQLYISIIDGTDIESFSQKVRREKHFDIYLLDIKIQEKDTWGLTLGTRVQELDPHGRIVFLTSYGNFAVNGFQMRAYYYILKDNSWRVELRELLSRILKEEEENREEFVILSEGGIRCSILMNDIMYLTKEKKYTVYHCVDRREGSKGGQCQEYKERASLETVWERLPKERFLMISRGVVINMKHVIRTDSKGVIMRDQSGLPISKNRREQVCDDMAAYWGEKI